MQKLRHEGTKTEIDHDSPEVKAYEKLLRKGPNSLTTRTRPS
jgi:hypothetical protein